MAGPKTAAVLLTSKYFKRYQQQIVRLLQKKRPFSSESDNADTVGGYNDQDLLKQARADLAAHIGRKDNPHQESMDTQGAYTESTVMKKLAKKIPNSVVPISNYGVVENLTDAQVQSMWSFSGFKLSVNSAFTVILSGTPYVLGGGVIDLAAIETPANKTFNVYVRLQFGVISYQAQTASPPESVSIMFIGKAVCGPNGITSIQFATVNRIETFRVSTEPVGSAIPVTKGTYDSITPLPAAWNPL